jgi:hypothetical protein
MPSAAACGSATALASTRACSTDAMAACSSASSFRQSGPRLAHSAARDFRVGQIVLC